MKKKLFILGALLISVLTLSGCDDNTNTMMAYTSVYPVEYILDNLYGDKIAIYGIYPDGTDYKNYNLTNKQLADYSKGDLYVYNGTIQKEKDYAVKMLNDNKKIKIIDASQGMSYTNDVSETWLNPSNYLMMASNIKNGLEEYVEERVNLKKINTNYNELKLSLSEIDAELKQLASSSSNPTILVSDNTFSFLEKYGFTVISLKENDNLSDKILADVKKMAANKTIQYMFAVDNAKLNDTAKSIVDTYSLTTVNLNSLSTLNATDRKDKKNYVSIMEDNINSIKLEINN